MPNDLSYPERCFVSALAKTNSNKIGKDHGIVGPEETKRIQTLGFYLKKNKFDLAASHRIDSDKLESDRLYRYYVIPVTIPNPDKGGGEFHINLIVDPKGRDIGFIPTNGDFQEIGEPFQLAEGLKDKQNEILKVLEQNSSAISQETIQGVAVKSLGDVVDRIVEHEKIVPDSPGEALEKINKKEKRSLEYDKDEKQVVDPEQEQDKEKEKNPNQLSEEEINKRMHENNDIDSKDYDKVREMCMDNGLDPSKLKQKITVDTPESVSNKMDDRFTKIDERGSAVTMYRFSTADVSKGGADVVILEQNNRILPYDGSNDQALTEIMEQHPGNNVNVRDLDDNREDEYYLKVEAEKMRYVQEIRELNDEAAAGKITDEEHDNMVGQKTVEHEHNIYMMAESLMLNDKVQEDVDRTVDTAYEISEEIKRDEGEAKAQPSKPTAPDDQSDSNEDPHIPLFGPKHNFF